MERVGETGVLGGAAEASALLSPLLGLRRGVTERAAGP